MESIRAAAATVSAIVASLLFFLSFLHVYWALGGRIAFLAAITQIDGKPAFVPSKGATWAVAVVLSSFAFLTLANAHIVRVGYDRPIQILNFATAGIFILRAIGDFRLIGFFKRITKSDFAKLDTFLYSPLCLVIGVSLLLLSMS